MRSLCTFFPIAFLAVRIAQATNSSVKASATSFAPATTTAIVIPAGCTMPPATHQMTNFSWYNSTHNLDCVNGPDLGNGTGCYKPSSTGMSVCDPSYEQCGLCGVEVCSTGLPYDGVLGYGPPDRISITIDDYACTESNPQSIRRWEVGDGVVGCGSAADIIDFIGSSNDAVNNGTVYFNEPLQGCYNGDRLKAYYKANIVVNCTHDSGGNATCVTALPVTLPMVRLELISS
jgi:hypothetical protein